MRLIPVADLHSQFQRPGHSGAVRPEIVRGTRCDLAPSSDRQVWRRFASSTKSAFSAPIAYRDCSSIKQLGWSSASKDSTQGVHIAIRNVNFGSGRRLSCFYRRYIKESAAIDRTRLYTHVELYRQRAKFHVKLLIPF